MLKYYNKLKKSYYMRYPSNQKVDEYSERMWGEKLLLTTSIRKIELLPIMLLQAVKLIPHNIKIDGEVQIFPRTWIPIKIKPQFRTTITFNYNGYIFDLNIINATYEIFVYCILTGNDKSNENTLFSITEQILKLC